MAAGAIRATIGPYQLLREIGRGATGVVYLAEHRQRRRRTVVKVLRPELTAHTELLARFFADAQGTSALRHPAIVEVLACDVDTGGHAYVAMEPLTGQSLTALLGARGKLSFFEAAALAGNVAHALGVAHEHGIAHGDLKPEHLFLPDAPRGAVKVLDFGIGRLASAAAAGAAAAMAHAGTGVRTTPGPRGPRLYLSPEHTQGDGASGVDHLSDIYSLGAILYAMLSGHPPFAVATDDELAAMQRRRRPATLSSIERTVPRVLSELVQSMLDPSPRHRPQSAEAVIDILREVAPVPDPRRVTAVIPAPVEPLAAPPFPRSTVVLPAPVVPSPALLQTVKIPAPLVPRPPSTTSGLVRSPSRRHRQVAGPRAVVTATLAGLGIGLAALAIWIAASDPTPLAVVGTPAAPLAVHEPAAPSPSPSPSRASAPSPSLAAAIPLVRPAPPATTSNAVPAPRVEGRKPRRTVRLSLVTIPAGADVCLGESSDSVATTPDPLRLRRQRGPRQVVLYRPGYRTERISVPGDRDVRRAIELRPLATDDLHEPPPCR